MRTWRGREKLLNMRNTFTKMQLLFELLLFYKSTQNVTLLKEYIQFFCYISKEIYNISLTIFWIQLKHPDRDPTVLVCIFILLRMITHNFLLITIIKTAFQIDNFICTRKIGFFNTNKFSQEVEIKNFSIIKCQKFIPSINTIQN